MSAYLVFAEEVPLGVTRRDGPTAVNGEMSLRRQLRATIGLMRQGKQRIHLITWSSHTLNTRATIIAKYVCYAVNSR